MQTFKGALLKNTIKEGILFALIYGENVIIEHNERYYSIKPHMIIDFVLKNMREK